MLKPERIAVKAQSQLEIDCKIIEAKFSGRVHVSKSKKIPIQIYKDISVKHDDYLIESNRRNSG